jgi:hypothetical protein
VGCLICCPIRSKEEKNKDGRNNIYGEVNPGDGKGMEEMKYNGWKDKKII